ncbi:MAG: hypothetical protein QOG52_1662 [Frankiaceae bacterium]|nr:hypothetical protein [Frankiaceae bacterium]
MTSAAEGYDALCEELLTSPGVTIGRALSNEGLMVGGKLFAFLRRDRLVVKLPVARVAELIEDGTGDEALMGKRRMKQWVEVALDSHWSPVARESCDYVRQLHAG